MVEGEQSMPRDIQASGAVRFHPGPYPIQSVYKRHSPNPRGLLSPLCRWYTHTQNRSQRGLCSRKTATRSHVNESCFERWYIKINEDKNQVIYFSHRRRPVEAYRTLKGRQVPFIDNTKYLGVIFYEKIHGDCM